MGGCWRYHVSLEGTVYSKLVNTEIAQGQDETTTIVVHKGAQLGKKLMEMAEGRRGDQVWELLADLWTELMVYLAAFRASKEANELEGRKADIQESCSISISSNRLSSS